MLWVVLRYVAYLQEVLVVGCDVMWWGMVWYGMVWYRLWYGSYHD